MNWESRSLAPTLTMRNPGESRKWFGDVSWFYPDCRHSHWREAYNHINDRSQRTLKVLFVNFKIKKYISWHLFAICKALYSGWDVSKSIWLNQMAPWTVPPGCPTGILGSTWPVLYSSSVYPIELLPLYSLSQLKAPARTQSPEP